MSTCRISHSAFWKRYGHEEWDNTVISHALKRLPAITPAGPWIAGGGVRRIVADADGESDFDFFFASADQCAAFAAQLETSGAKKNYENEFNVTYTLPAAEKEPALKVQLIRIRYHATIEDVLESFDFSLCQCGYDGTDLVFGTFTLFDVANKKLIPGRITYGVSSLRRMIKYTKQGYRVCGGGLATMLEQIVADPSIIQAKVEYLD